jgi:Fuc2NAc and GlcNAc transferase
LVLSWDDRTLLEVVAVGISALLAAALATGVVRKFALLHGVIDVPNERSSHNAPTPRGGGLAIAVTSTIALAILTWLGVTRIELLFALGGGGIAVAAVGFLDDQRPVPVRFRLAVHLGAALWALFWLDGLPPLRLGQQLITFGWSGYVLGMLGIVWVLNLFNFMDGIDGLAATEAVFVAWGGTLLAIVAGMSTGVPAIATAFGAACCGFALWNWPPAKIFMGDVGSGYLGYMIAVLAVAAAGENPVALLVWWILGAVFFVDATATLIRRLARGERVHAAHRSHAYQWLARRWGSHRSVTVVVLFINLLWVLPCAGYAALHPEGAAWAVVIAFGPLTVLSIASGAGRRETPTP